jgi:hypothetical protein
MITTQKHTMERNQNYYDRNYPQRDNMPESSERYEHHGNYYGMPDSGAAYDNVRMRETDFRSHNTSGPVGGYGASNYHKDYNQSNRNAQHEGSNYRRQNHDQQDWRNESYRSHDRGRTNREPDYDPSYSSSYDVAGNRMYSRQENSYDNPGHGRRYGDYGRDERRNYGHELTDIHHDRGSFDHSRSDNDYNSSYRPENRFDSDNRQEDYRFKGSIEDRGSRDNYNNENYNRGRRPSGPDYSKNSPISGYGYDNFGI